MKNKNNPPEEMKESYEEAQAMGKKMAASFLKLMPYKPGYCTSRRREAKKTAAKPEVGGRFDRRHIGQYVEDQNDRQPRCLEM